jgi:hypothetical protein
VTAGAARARGSRRHAPLVVRPVARYARRRAEILEFSRVERLAGGRLARCNREAIDAVPDSTAAPI